MAYDKILAQRVREIMGGLPGLVEKQMFGGLSFMVNGNLACGVIQDELIVRVGQQEYPAALSKPHARVFDMSGRPMKGWVTVGSQGCRSEDALREWVRTGIDFALSLPEK